MEIRVLRYFLTVAREENITHAAEVLHMTQPTLSRQLMQLEKSLNTKLFIRGKHRITLTDEGMMLRRRAEEIVELADKTEREFLAQEDFVAGEIFIGSGEVSAMHLLAKVAKELRDEYPNITYSLYSGNADAIKEKLDRGLLDIGLLTEPVDIEKYEFIRLPKKEVWGVIMREDSELASLDIVTASDLKDKPIIQTSRSMVVNEISHWFGSSYKELDIIASYNLIYNAAVMVEEGMGYAICLEKLIPTNKHNTLCFRPLSPALETGTVIVWKKHQIFSPATTRLINKLKNAYQA